MKKTLFVILILAIALIACQKEVETVNFETIEFKDARLEKGGLLTIVDTPREILKYQDHGGLIDTLGETKVFLHYDLLIHRDWATAYMSPKHFKTNFLYTLKDHVVIVLVSSISPFFDRMYIINDGVKKEFPFSVEEIKKAEIDLGRQIIRIKFNNSWARSGPIPDETKEFNF